MKVIWGKNKQTGKIEVIDKAIGQNKNYLVGEYILAFGTGWIIWYGNKKDMPKEQLKWKKQ